jgi:hypothetical protein
MSSCQSGSQVREVGQERMKCEVGRADGLPQAIEADRTSPHSTLIQLLWHFIYTLYTLSEPYPILPIVTLRTLQRHHGGR